MITIEPAELGVKEGEAILDAGCGEGRHSWELAKGENWVFALDIDYDSVYKSYHALKYLEYEGHTRGSYCAVAGHVEALPFHDESFDHVLCSEVLEHVDDVFEATAELVRVLKPGGTIGVSVPTWITEVFYWRLDKNYSHPGGHIRIFKAREIRDILESFNLKVYGRDRRHSLHSPYWFLLCLFGLHNENALLPSTYHRFLTWVESKPRPFFKAVERVLDPLMAKSQVFYARKENAGAVAVADARARSRYPHKE